MIATLIEYNYYELNVIYSEFKNLKSIYSALN